ncbi:MAG: type VII secretion protein EssC [Coriobacteriales bacterium]|jgi:S-DNA-T family DNA segregation ATPase FtsK/SpoIIIE|nr:type VII secretion protein EssC [Coriobacteriales bacterium]
MPTLCTLIRNDQIFTTTLPDAVSGRYEIADLDAYDRPRPLAYIEAQDENWYLSCFGGAQLLTSGDGKIGKNAETTDSDLDSSMARVRLGSDDTMLQILNNQNEVYSLFIRQPPAGETTYQKFIFASPGEICMGRSEENDLILASPFVSSRHATLRYKQDGFFLYDHGSANGSFINDLRVDADCAHKLAFGDCIWIMGLKLIIGQDFFTLNHPAPLAANYQKQLLAKGINEYRLPLPLPEHDDKMDGTLRGGQGSAFFRSPRVWRQVSPAEFIIEEPPSMQETEEPPALLRIGPSLAMAMGSGLMAVNMFSNAASGSSLMTMVSSGGMVFVMVLGAVLWPILQTRYNKRKGVSKEEKRQSLYLRYLDRRWAEIERARQLQATIFSENRLSASECLRLLMRQDRRLFERMPSNADFLEVRLGKGIERFQAQIKWPADKLTLTVDPLFERVLEYSRLNLDLDGIPVALSLIERNVIGLTSGFAAGLERRKLLWAYLRDLLIQVITLHAPDEVKLVLFVENAERMEWNFATALPNVFTNNEEIRLIAATIGEAAYLSRYLEQILAQRAESKDPDSRSQRPLPHFILINANGEIGKNLHIIKRISALSDNCGFSIIQIAENITDLAKDTNCIIEFDLDANRSQKKVAAETESLMADKASWYDPADPAQQILFTCDPAVPLEESRQIPCHMSALNYTQHQEITSVLPKSLGFFEMFRVGKPEHLNIIRRWKDSDPIHSLAAPLGLGGDGEMCFVDVHEDAHGPHGLVAGTTGSGKSELIISYILSLCVRFKPDELSFVLIDYKGGGLAGIFDGKEYRLPHLSGTITNLDGAAINRSLVSIRSELRRRQAKFNEARDIAGLGSVDIYKYQELYRAGIVSDPIAHLMIISDEFAELKAQQPDFMDELISTARIGRSLGVHLILATQKPTGVVNDQIWTNSRFKLCLKVADAADSKEMIRREDAAALTQPGRYCFLVGYNELFETAQGAYSGGRYIPAETYVEKVDNSVVLISDTGQQLTAATPKAQHNVATEAVADIPEAVALFRHICECACKESLFASKLWLEPIPPLITLNTIYAKYGDQVRESSVDSCILDPLIGELDDPENQTQRPLTLPLTDQGNTIIYGSTGSGKAQLLFTLLYDLISLHSPATFNAYLLDFGAETLGAFGHAPQVGDVIYALESDKLESFFKLLHAKLTRRKRFFVDRGDGFAAFARQPPAADDGTTMPTILVVINNFEVFSELYEEKMDALVSITRDGLRYGIIFILTCSRSNAVSYRLLPNFSQRLVLQMNSSDDYLSIFGSMRGVLPPAGFARGLIQSGALYEFQACHITDDGSDRQAVQTLATTLFARTTSAQPGWVAAPKTPVLPERVTLADFDDLLTVRRLPLGISKEDIEPLYHDFSAQRVFCVFGSDSNLLSEFFGGLLEASATLESVRRVMVIKPGLSLPEPASDILLVIPDLAAVWAAQGEDARETWIPFFESGAHRALAGVLIGGDPAGFGTFKYDGWYNSLTSQFGGVWLGAGLDSQNFFSLNYAREYAQVLPAGFGWAIRNGKAILMKYLTAPHFKMLEPSP